MIIYYEILRSYRHIRKFDDQFDFLSLVIQGFTNYPLIFVGTTHNAAALTLINNTYLGLINDAKGGDTTAMDIRDQYYTNIWLPAVDLTAKEVEEDIAQGDKVIIDKSGFKPTAGTKVKAEVPKQMHIEVKSQNVGELSYKSDTKDVGKDAGYFLICGTRPVTNFTQEADGSVVIETSGPAQIRIYPLRNKRGILKGLPSEEKMSVYIAAVNAAGVGPLSQEAKIVIQ
jgi:hypothetical protein